jgi:hypothetical protein
MVLVTDVGLTAERSQAVPSQDIFLNFAGLEEK